MADRLVLDGRPLTCAEVERLSRGGVTVTLSDSVRARIIAGEAEYRRRSEDDVLRSKWGWLVGGPAPADSLTAARRFVIDHCAGVGDPLPVEEVRAAMLARACALSVGFSGVRIAIVDRLLQMLSRDLIPVVPQIGAVGAAGSIQLAHIARVALGLGGSLWFEGQIVPASDWIGEGKPLPALQPTEKEALALLNGSSFTSALAALAVARSARLLQSAEAATALSMEVIRADTHALSLAAAAARGHRGILEATERLRALLNGSTLVTPQRSPDSFSVRCAPTVLGAARDALRYVEGVVTGELNAPSDNPLVFPDEGLIEAGHFHAAPSALAADHLKIALVQVASIAERRIFRLTYGRLSGLPSFLVPGSGVNSGLMIAQYTAASLLAEAKALCMPASIDSIPTVQHQEDHVSMGPIAARSALEVADRVADILAIELLCAAQGLDFRMEGRAVDAHGSLISVEPGQPAPATRAIYDRIRTHVSRWEDDQVLHTDLVALGRAVREGVFSSGLGALASGVSR